MDARALCLSVLLLLMGGICAADAAGPANPAPTVRCPSALCRSGEASKQLSGGYRTCMAGARGAVAPMRLCVRHEQALQDRALATLHRVEDARQLGSASMPLFDADRRLFSTARRKVCRAISREQVGEAAKLFFEQCTLHRTADRVVRQRWGLL